MEKNKNILIFGYSKSAKELVKIFLDKKYHFKIIDTNQKNVNQAIIDGYRASFVNLEEDYDLIKAGLGSNVGSFFCFSADDNENLFAVISARNIDKNLKILALSSSLDNEQKMILAGADRVVTPYALGAHRIVRLLRKPLLLDILDKILFSKTDIIMADVCLAKDSFLEGLRLLEVDVEQKYNLVIIGVQDRELGKNFIFTAKRINHKLDAGDTLVVMGKIEDIEKFKLEVGGNL